MRAQHCEIGSIFSMIFYHGKLSRAATCKSGHPFTKRGCQYSPHIRLPFALQLLPKYAPSVDYCSGVVKLFFFVFPATSLSWGCELSRLSSSEKTNTILTVICVSISSVTCIMRPVDHKVRTPVRKYSAPAVHRYRLVAQFPWCWHTTTRFSFTDRGACAGEKKTTATMAREGYLYAAKLSEQAERCGWIHFVVSMSRGGP